MLYPLVMGSVHLFHKLPSLELGVLVGIYVTAGLGIIALWVIGKSKHVQIKEQQIVFHSLLGEHILEPKDIRRRCLLF